MGEKITHEKEQGLVHAEWYNRKLKINFRVKFRRVFG